MSKITVYEKALAEARGKYELPDYSKESHRDFVVNMHRHGYEIRHYHGCHYYEGPSVVVDGDGVKLAMSRALVACLTDSMGFDFVVYPK